MHFCPTATQTLSTNMKHIIREAILGFENRLSLLKRHQSLVNTRVWFQTIVLSLRQAALLFDFEMTATTFRYLHTPCCFHVVNSCISNVCFSLFKIIFIYRRWSDVPFRHSLFHASLLNCSTKAPNPGTSWPEIHRLCAKCSWGKNEWRWMCHPFFFP